MTNIELAVNQVYSNMDAVTDSNDRLSDAANELHALLSKEARAVFALFAEMRTDRDDADQFFTKNEVLCALAQEDAKSADLDANPGEASIAFPTKYNKKLVSLMRSVLIKI